VWADELAGYVVVPVGGASPIAVDTWNASIWHRADLEAEPGGEIQESRPHA
jgi:hypothetical protein